MSAGNLKIKITDSKGTQVVSVSKSTVTVGRAAHCDIVLEHPSVQPEHVRAWLEGGRIWVQDLGTSVGTALNGIRLPSLKPMLMRDLDVIKLGDFPATLGFELNLVRPPVVKPDFESDEITATDFRLIVSQEPNSEAAEKRMEELSREVADLKFKLQTAKLDSNSAEEMRRQIKESQNELRAVVEQNQKLTEVVVSLEREKQSAKESLENELAEHKLKALRDLKDQKDSDQQRFDVWKAEAVLELSRQLRQQAQNKVKSWASRPMSGDLVYEWEADLGRMFRRVILNEDTFVALPQVSEARGDGESAPTRVEKEGKAPTSGPSEPPQPPPVQRSSAKSVVSQDQLLRYVLASVGSACVAAVLFLLVSYFRNSEAPRSLASAPPEVMAVSSRSVQTQPQKVVAPPPSTATPSGPSPAIVKSAQPVVALNKPLKYEAKQNRIYKKTYVENILFTTNFEQVEMSKDYRRKWSYELNAAMKTWKLDPKLAEILISKELELISDLKRLKTSATQDKEKEMLAKMNRREITFLKDLEALLKNKQNVDKFLKLKQGFFARNYQFVGAR